MSALVKNIDGYRNRTPPPGDGAPAVNGFEFSDVGNGKRFAAMFGNDVRYVEDWSKNFLVYDGTRWARDNTCAVERFAKEVGATILDEQSLRDIEPNDGGGNKKTPAEMRFAHYQYTQERKAINAMIAMARSELPIPARPDDFDTDPWLYNCATGTIDLRTGECREHQREDMFTKCSQVIYDAKAEAREWLKFLDKIMGGDEAMISFLARAVGSSLSGVINDRAVYILYGTGANGKTIFIETIRALFGSDYTSVMPIEALVATKFGSGIPTDVADLRGKRLAIASESDEGARLSLAKFKRLTGGDTLTGRQLYGHKFDFQPSHHLFLATNHKPNMRGATKAVWSRIKLIPFKVQIPENEQTPQEVLKALLRAELPGILNWALAGLKDWRENGLQAPTEVKMATVQWEHDDDLLREFLDEMTEQASGNFEAKAMVYQAWVNWCKDRNEFSGSQKRFGQWLLDHDVAEARTAHGRFWKDIKLKGGSAGNPPLDANARDRSARALQNDADGVFKLESE